MRRVDPGAHLQDQRLRGGRLATWHAPCGVRPPGGAPGWPAQSTDVICRLLMTALVRGDQGPDMCCPSPHRAPHRNVPNPRQMFYLCKASAPHPLHCSLLLPPPARRCSAPAVCTASRSLINSSSAARRAAHAPRRHRRQHHIGGRLPGVWQPSGVQVSTGDRREGRREECRRK